METGNKLLLLGGLSGLAMAAADALKRANDMAMAAKRRGFETPTMIPAIEAVNNLCTELRIKSEQT